MQLFSRELINPLHCFVNQGSNILASWNTLRSPTSAIRVSACTLAASLLWVKDLEDLNLKIAVATMRLIYDFCLNWSSEDFRVIIVDIISELLHILCRLMLVLRVAEHVADLLQMIRGLQPDKPLASTLLVSVPPGDLLILNTSLGPGHQIGGSLSVPRSAAAFLREIREIARNNKVQISQPTPEVEAGRELLRVFMLLYLAQLRADDLNEDLVLLKEGGLQLQHRGDPLGNRVDAAVLIREDIIVVFTCGLNQTYVLDIVL